MQNELDLTPTQSIILIIVCLVILILLWRYESHIELEISPQRKSPQTTYKSAMGLMYGLLVRNLTRRHFMIYTIDIYPDRQTEVTE